MHRGGSRRHVGPTCPMNSGRRRVVVFPPGNSHLHCFRAFFGPSPRAPRGRESNVKYYKIRTKTHRKEVTATVKNCSSREPHKTSGSRDSHRPLTFLILLILLLGRSIGCTTVRVDALLFRDLYVVCRSTAVLLEL